MTQYYTLTRASLKIYMWRSAIDGRVAYVGLLSGSYSQWRRLYYALALFARMFIISTFGMREWAETSGHTSSIK